MGMRSPSSAQRTPNKLSLQPLFNILLSFHARGFVLVGKKIIIMALAIRLLNDLGRRISSISGDTRETRHLYQRVSVLMQRFNAVLLHHSLPVPDCTD